MGDGPYYEVFEDDAGEHRWRLVARNGEIVGQSEGYSTKDGAIDGAKANRRAAADATLHVKPTEG